MGKLQTVEQRRSDYAFESIKIVKGKPIEKSIIIDRKTCNFDS
ncbi:MAG: hypothetical protein N2Z80_04610 [Hydrogenothermaceae bacterium]|nr:hypothetical protein [Hydrogenothermaceae bacterium]